MHCNGAFQGILSMIFGIHLKGEPKKYVDIEQQNCTLKSNIPAKPVCSWRKLKQMGV